MILVFNNKEHEFIISGIYQDVTSGGFTAKSVYDFSEVESVKYSFSINLLDNSNIEENADEWSNLIGTGVTVDPMDEFINQTLGGVATQLKTIVLATVIVGSFIAMLITVLFLKLRLAKDSSDIAVLKAIGFSKKDIKQQYIIKIGTVSLVGILAGLIFTNLLGEKFVEAALSISGLGIKKIELIINPLTQYIIYPILLMVLILAVTWIVVKSIDKYNIISIINE
jgi:putative ABC transport system permease protein